MNRLVSVSIFLMSILAGCTLGVPTQPAVKPLPEAEGSSMEAAPAALQNGVIAFLSARDGDLEVFTVAPDGSALSKISDNETDDFFPTWSPDGNQLAFLPGDGTEQYLVADASCAYLLEGCAQPPAASVLGEFPTYEWDTHFQPGADTATGYLYSNDPSGTGNSDIFVEFISGSPQPLAADPGQDDFPAWSKDGARIAFSSNRGGVDYEIFVMNADGSNLVQLTNNDTDDLAPTWSPDGAQIAFMPYRGNWEIFVIGVDGTGEMNVSNNPADDNSPVWSPRPGVTAAAGSQGNAPGASPDTNGTPPASSGESLGGRIVFASDREDGNLEIYSMNADGSELTRLTNETAKDTQPVWSPDGTRIAFVSERDGDRELYVMNADGTGATRLTYAPGMDGNAAWSPDGSRIAFESARDGQGAAEIYVMNADGSNPVNVSNSSFEDNSPRWSRSYPNILHFTTSGPDITVSVDVETGQPGFQPDTYTRFPIFSPFGDMLFIKVLNDQQEIFLWNGVDGEGINLTNNPAIDVNPSWSPDGNHIVFDTDRDGNVEIYIVDKQGRSLVNITNHPAFDGFPNWGP